MRYNYDEFNIQKELNMGFFSWKTQDTQKSISNQHSGIPVFTVYLHDHKGNKWREDTYNGYGVFGGKDFYVLLAEMNGLPADRSAGLQLLISTDSEDILFPNLTESSEWTYMNKQPIDCYYQGFFYPGEEFIEAFFEEDSVDNSKNNGFGA
jgi:hypothetical protein